MEKSTPPLSATVFNLFLQLNDEQRLWFLTLLYREQDAEGRQELTSRFEPKLWMLFANIAAMTEELFRMTKEHQARTPRPKARRAEEHARWAELHESGMSYGLIAKKRSRETGEPISPAAVSKAIQRRARHKPNGESKS
jgi:hypothetical protein